MIIRIYLTLIIVIGSGSLIYSQVLGPNYVRSGVLIKADTMYFIPDSNKFKQADFKWFKQKTHILWYPKYKELLDAPLGDAVIVVRLKRKYFEKIKLLK